ncbi:hypothetical protein TNCT_197991 [Trichonephila clavata]|uniref:Uncharacterized protein n=1 Tax=Trichonephila clavata TaxID=2740835 RepID=A0A8X6FGZ3_TRICU|nr:hypothetical protein TNCT_197991 [Trichonephila clavata]
MNTDETDMYLSVGSFQKEIQTYTNRLCGGCCPSPSTWQLIGNTINGLPQMTSRTHCSCSCQLGEWVPASSVTSDNLQCDCALRI